MVLDVWCGDGSLKEAFLDLFEISQERDAFVADLMKFCNYVIQWDLNFLRSMHDWEFEPLSIFIKLIYSLGSQLGERVLRLKDIIVHGSLHWYAFSLEKHLEVEGPI